METMATLYELQAMVDGPKLPARTSNVKKAQSQWAVATLGVLGVRHTPGQISVGKSSKSYTQSAN